MKVIRLYPFKRVRELKQEIQNLKESYGPDKDKFIKELKDHIWELESSWARDEIKRLGL